MIKKEINIKLLNLFELIRNDLGYYPTLLTTNQNNLNYNEDLFEWYNNLMLNCNGNKSEVIPKLIYEYDNKYKSIITSLILVDYHIYIRLTSDTDYIYVILTDYPNIELKVYENHYKFINDLYNDKNKLYINKNIPVEFIKRLNKINNNNIFIIKDK